MEQQTEAAAPPALAGTTVLELTTELPGAWCGRLLAMLGADVIKVESAAHPDRARLAGPFPGDEPHPERSGAHRYLHAQKRSLALDVTTPARFDLLRRLAATADVVLDDGVLGRPPEVRDRYQALLDGNERLIVNAFSPYGLDGPKAGWISTELTDLAASGWLASAPVAGEPLMPGVPCGHYGAGTFGALGVVLALQARRRTGRGQLVETPLNEALLSILTAPTTLLAMYGIEGLRMGDGFPYGIYRCADGWLGVSVLTQGHWTGLCQLMGRPELATDPRFRTGAERADPEAGAEIDRILRAWLVDQPAQATFERGQALRVPVAIVPSPREVLASPQYEARHYWVDHDDPELGPIRLPGHPFRSATGAFAPFRPAPALGADTDAVLAAVEGLAAGSPAGQIQGQGGLVR